MVVNSSPLKQLLLTCKLKFFKIKTVGSTLKKIIRKSNIVAPYTLKLFSMIDTHPIALRSHYLKYLKYVVDKSVRFSEITQNYKNYENLVYA